MASVNLSGTFRADASIKSIQRGVYIFAASGSPRGITISIANVDTSRASLRITIWDTTTVGQAPIGMATLETNGFGVSWIQLTRSANYNNYDPATGMLPGISWEVVEY